MIKKIVLWVVYAGVVGLLVFGAVNRTEAKAEAGVGEFKYLSESHQYELGKQENSGNSQGEGRRDDGQGRAAGIEANPASEYQANEEDHAWNILEGSVDSISEELLEIELSDGEILVIEGQAWRYVLSSGFVSAVGNLFEVNGFFEEGEYKVSWMKDLSTGQEIEVRDPSGRPNWAGRK
jgi:hypothetical protein